VSIFVPFSPSFGDEEPCPHCVGFFCFDVALTPDGLPLKTYQSCTFWVGKNGSFMALV
jgi:hypothetical protein